MAGPDDARFAEAVEVDGGTEGVVPRESGCLFWMKLHMFFFVFSMFSEVISSNDEGTSKVTFSLSIFFCLFVKPLPKRHPNHPVTPRYSYSHFVERFKHPSAQAVVNEIRDFVNEFPANLTRLQAARRIHHFLGQVTPKLLQVGRVGNGWVGCEIR